MIGRVRVWLTGIGLLLLVLAVLSLSGRLQIHSNLLALLPAPQRDPVAAAALERIGDLGEQRLVILVAAGTPQHNTRAAQALAQSLTQSDAFAQVLRSAADLLDDSKRKAAQSLLFKHRFHLLSPADQAALDRLTQPPADDHKSALRHFMSRARTALYGIGAGRGTAHFIQDPLGLTTAYRSARVAGVTLPGLRLASDGHFYVTSDTGRRFAVIFAQSERDPFTLAAQQAQLAALDQARAAVPDAIVLVSGVLPHAAAATQQARSETSIIGAGSLAGILLLILWAFGSVRPFLLSIAAMAGGCLLALVATGALFGTIHVITLVFGASIVGVAVDYCMHFFAQRWDTPDPHQAIHHILPAISLGLIANVLAYSSMTVADFPGLRQMGVFSVFGLIGAWLGVVLLLPAVAGRPPRSGRALRLAQLWLTHGPARLGQHRGALLAAMAVLLVITGGLTAAYLQPQDDIGLLYNAPQELRHTEQQVAQLLGTQGAGKTIVVRGDSVAAVLQNEAKLVQALSGPTPIADVTAITQAFPTPAEQRRNYAQLAHSLYAPDGPVHELLRDVGYSRTRIQAHMDRFAAGQDHILQFQQWLHSPASTGLRGLWLGQVGDQWATLIRVPHTNTPAQLRQLVGQDAQATLIDRGARISRMLGHYRDLATWLLGVAYVVALVLLCWPLGLRGALTVILPPMLASVTVALVFALTGWPFSMFNLLAMILLLGLGSDYGIFLRMASERNASAMLAVGASAMTNLLSFGLLALSATPALHSFGLTLALGLGLTFILTSLVGGGTAAPAAVRNLKEHTT